MNKLTYKDYKWRLTVDGIEVPNSHLIIDGLKMLKDDVPTVEIVVDEVEISEVNIQDHRCQSPPKPSVEYIKRF